MRISDWSSDVCSSDLAARQVQVAGAVAAHAGLDLHPAAGGGAEGVLQQVDVLDLAVEDDLARRQLLAVVLRDDCGQHLGRAVAAVGFREIGRASCRESVCKYV